MRRVSIRSICCSPTPISRTRPAVSAELAARAASGYDLVSYMATLHCGNVAERALIPAFVFFFFQLYPPAWGTRRGGRMHAFATPHTRARRRHRTRFAEN